MRIVNVAKRERPGDAEINASRRCLGILPRPQAARDARVDDVRAECAFGGDADEGIVSTQLLIDRWLFAEGELPFFNLVARLVGARHGAGSAAYTKIIDNLHDAVGASTSRGGRADPLARRISTVLTTRRNEDAPHIGIIANFHIEDASPLHARRRRVSLLARRGAGLATDASP